MLTNILTASIHGSIVIAAVMLLRLVLRKVPKKFICLLWLLAGIRLLLPIPVKSPFSLQPSLSLPWLDAFRGWPLTLIWAAVAAGFAVYSVVSYCKLRCRVQEAVRIPGGWESDRIETAFILGFFKPRIYLPMGMSSQNRRYILEHERTHLDKGDHWIKMIGFLALALHWFNPLVWAAYILLCKDIEMACDERVVQFMDLDDRKGYSHALLTFSTARPHLSNPVAFGEVNVKERIFSVLRYKKPGVFLSLLGILALCFVTVCLVTNPDTPKDVPLTPEQQAQQDTMAACYQDVQQLLSQDTFYLELLGGNYTTEDRSGVTPVWFVTLCRQDGNTLWEYIPSSSPEPTQGCLSLDGETYALYQGKWVQTDQADSQWQAYLDAILWDPETVQFVQEETNERGRSVHFTAQWQDAQETTYTNTIRCTYNSRGKFAELKMDTSRFPDAQVLMLSPHVDMPGEEPADIGQMMRTRKESVQLGQVSSQELAAEAEALSWGVSFRVDDDRLSPSGSDVYVGQTATGKGSLSTGMEYWLEKKVNGQWEKLPTITDAPAVTSDGISLAKGGPSTYGYLDWTPLYGQLKPGEYRMGKLFRNHYNNISSTLTFYSEFTIAQTVDSNSPEAAAAVQRCYDAVDELKARDHIHFKENCFGADEFWIHGNNYLKINDFGQDNYEPENSGRIDIYARWDNIGYRQVWNDPEVRGSGVRGMALYSLDANRWPGTISDLSFNLHFFERNNYTASFPEGVGVISDEMVRFVLTWPVAGLEMPEASAQLTYKFNAQGQLTYMEYMPLWEDAFKSSYMEILDTSAEEIDAKIRSYTKDLIVDSFSWQEAQAKYTDADFNIRQDSFVNNGGAPITGSVDAAKLALKEYPNLTDYLSLTVFRDEAAGMWKVTVMDDVVVQSTYDYRDIYLTDDGQTKLLVYEGTLSFDEPRK